MRDRLPPLFTLQAFESAARHGSFSRAANELKLTPGAISRQIRQLEEWCSLTLFERNGPRVELTSEGQNLLSRLGGPLSALHQAIFPGNDTVEQSLHISTLVSTANAWLLPCLSDFAAAHPHIRLVLETDYSLVRPQPMIPMVLLRYGTPPGQELHTEVLFEDRIVAVASPALAGTIGTDPKAWKSATFLQHSYLNARAWCKAAGISDHFAPTGTTFNDADVMLGAAALGMGVALCRLSLAWPRLESGSLVLACDVACKSANSNLLITRQESHELPAVQHFLQWIRPVAAEIRNRLISFDQAEQRLRLAFYKKCAA
jgi:LysR family transcriptional regulator, glycine cleavage system transcriptional activator